MKTIGEQRITLSEEKLQQCIEFAHNSAKSQQAIEFGSYETKPRGIPELARDNLIGKLAESAFADFLMSQFGLYTKLDFGVYPRGVWDREDFQIYDKNVDVKGTRSGGRWLLVELNKLEFRKQEGLLPDYFLFAAVGWDRRNDSPLGFVDLKGYASLHEICHPERIGERNLRICEDIPNTLFLAEGSFIPGTKTPLQADNCARSIIHLRKNWEVLVQSAKL